MNAEQALLFCNIASTGIALGLKHRYEWFSNYLIHMPQAMDYQAMPAATIAAYDAFIAFERMTAGCSAEQAELDGLSHQDFHRAVAEWYAFQKTGEVR
jgi:hypothetical protein